MSIISLAARRIGRLVATILFASTALFFLLRMIPGDPARVAAGFQADEQSIEQIRIQYGLDASLPVQYLRWIAATVSLNFGNSYASGRPVMELLLPRLGLTLAMAVCAMLLALIIALPAGFAAALHRDQWLDRLLMGASHILLAIPEFWLAILLLLAFSVALPLFPLFGSQSPLHLVLPIAALALGRAAFLSRLVRSAVLRELQREYPQFLGQLGLRSKRIALKHLLPNVLIPVSVPSAIQFGYLLGGAIIIEQVFAMGGTGRLLMQAVSTRDFPVIQAAVILFALIFSLVNFLADLLSAVADPRSRL